MGDEAFLNQKEWAHPHISPLPWTGCVLHNVLQFGPNFPRSPADVTSDDAECASSTAWIQEEEARWTQTSVCAVWILSRVKTTLRTKPGQHPNIYRIRVRVMEAASTGMLPRRLGWWLQLPWRLSCHYWVLFVDPALLSKPCVGLRPVSGYKAPDVVHTANTSYYSFAVVLFWQPCLALKCCMVLLEGEHYYIIWGGPWEDKLDHFFAFLTVPWYLVPLYNITLTVPRHSVGTPWLMWNYHGTILVSSTTYHLIPW